MTKKKFIQLMNGLLSFRKDEDNLNEAFKKFEPSFNGFCFARIEDLMINMLREATDDEYDYISYWIYDLEEGKKAEKGSVLDRNDKPVPIKTLSDLYNIIHNKDV